MDDDDACDFLFRAISRLIGLKGLLIWINVIHLTALLFLFQLLFWVSAQLLEDTDVGGLFPVT